MTDFKAKMHQIRFRAPPDPLAGFGGHTSKERGREGRRGKGGERRGGEGKGHERPHYLEEVYAYGSGCSGVYSGRVSDS